MIRDELQAEIINVIAPYRYKLPFEDVKAQITIILSDYDIATRKTELVVREEDKNQKYILMFIASKAAGGRTDRTLRSYKNYLTRIFNTIGKNADAITSDDIKLYLAKKLRIDKNAKVSVDNERRTLSTFYGWMQKNEYIEKNPMNKVETMKYSKPKKHAFSDMEVELIRGACKTEREVAVVEIMLSTWCRVSELVGIQIDEIEDDRILVHGKGEKDRYVFLNAKARIAIDNYLSKRKDNNPYLFPKSCRAGDVTDFTKGVPRCNQDRWYEKPEMVHETDPCDKGTIECMVRRIGKRAGVPNVHPHRFRRTGATFAMKAGMPIMTVSKLLGHANIAVTQVYLDINDEDLESAHGKYVR